MLREQVAQVARDEVVGRWAAESWTETAIEAELLHVVAELGRLPALVVDHVEDTHYGSGYASYVDVFVTRRDGSARAQLDHGRETTGLAVLLSRLAPVAAVSAVAVGRSRSHDGRSGTSYVPGLEQYDAVPDPRWARERAALDDALTTLGLTVASPQVLAELTPGIELDTLLGEPPYTVFDAWFHWMD